MIEYDGEFHFKSIKYFGGETALIETKLRDEIKNKYCIDNKIMLMRIPFYDFESIEKIVFSFLLKIKVLRE